MGFAIVASVVRLFCKLGSHLEQPVALRRTAGVVDYVLISCERCPHERALQGPPAAEWVKGWMKRS